MAAGVTLIGRVRELSKSTTAQTQDAKVLQFVHDGAKFLLNSLPKQELWHVASESTAITSDSGYSVNTNVVLGVYRDGITCEQVSNEEAYAYSSAVTATSLKAASKIFPIWYEQTGKIYIKPAPTGGESGKVILVDYESDVTTAASTWQLINIDGPAIKYAASLDAKAMAAYHLERATSAIGTEITGLATAFSNFASALPTYTSVTLHTISNTEIEDALTKAKNLIDNLGTIDVESYLTEDDPEMAQVAIQAASQEVGRAVREIEKESLNLQKDNIEITAETQEFQSNLAKAQSYLEEAATRIQAVQQARSYNESVTIYDNLSARLFQEAVAELQLMVDPRPRGDYGDSSGNNGEGRE